MMLIATASLLHRYMTESASYDRMVAANCVGWDFHRQLIVPNACYGEIIRNPDCNLYIYTSPYLCMVIVVGFHLACFE